jgi:hypothetical protein
VANSYNAEAPYLTSYALFPKFETLVASRRAWLALTTAQRAAVRQAIADTLAHARAALPDHEGQDLAKLCTNGVVLDQPSPAQLAALAREAGGPPTNAEVAVMMRTIRADVPGTGPQLSPIPVPAPCRTAQTMAQAISLHRLSLPARSSKQGATIPPGDYVTTDTVADFRAGGVQSGPDWNKPIKGTSTCTSRSQRRRPRLPRRRAHPRCYRYGDEGHLIGTAPGSPRDCALLLTAAVLQHPFRPDTPAGSAHRAPVAQVS